MYPFHFQNRGNLKEVNPNHHDLSLHKHLINY